MITITYDKECDGWYILLETPPEDETAVSEVIRTDCVCETGRTINIDYNKDGKPLGIEII